MILSYAKATVPHKWINKGENNIKPQNIVSMYAHLKKLNYIIPKFNLKRITSNCYPQGIEWFEMYHTILNICQETNIETTLTSYIDSNIVKDIKVELKRIYTLLYKLSKVEENKLTNDKISHCIQQRCIDYDTNLSKMINSILE